MGTGAFTLAQPLTALVAANFATGNGSSLSSIGGSLQLFYWSASAMGLFAGTQVFPWSSGYTGAHTYSTVVNGSATKAYRDGVQAGTTWNPGTSGTTTGLRISERNLANYISTTLFEVIVCAGALSDADRVAAQSYLKAKWGTP
jgi:hypothetical protein